MQNYNNFYIDIYELALISILKIGGLKTDLRSGESVVLILLR